MLLKFPLFKGILTKIFFNIAKITIKFNKFIRKDALAHILFIDRVLFIFDILYAIFTYVDLFR